MGIRDRPISPRAPWQNPYVERLIETLRRECLDHVLIFGEPHLRRVLTLYSVYYNETRTHLGLGKDAPLRRAVQRSGAKSCPDCIIATRGYSFREGQGTMWHYRGLLSLHVPGPTLVVEGDVCEITFGHQETARLISPDHPGLDMNSN